MKRVIITGGNGFIGKHLIRKLLAEKQCSIVLIANTSEFIDTELNENIPVTFYVSDIRDRDSISNIFRDEKADTCIHLAAKVSVADSIKNPNETMDINVNGTINVLEACHNSKVNNFVFASSAAVYGDVRKLPIVEDCLLKPLSPYGTSKMLAEQYISSYQQQKKIKSAISLRIFNVYGSGQSGESGVITRFAKSLSARQAPVIYGNGSQTRDFISVDDVADAILLSISLMEKAEHKVMLSNTILNVGTGKPTSIKQLAQKMITIFGLDLQPIYDEEKEGEGAILHSYADMTKSNEILHFIPKTTIDAGLKEMLTPMLLPK